MIKIEYPDYPYKIKTADGREMIFDELRKSWVRLTPEEWVRQNFLQYLVQVKKYPASMIAVEKEIYLGEMTKRFDVLVYNSVHTPWMMVECKSMEVVIDENVLHQVLRYNMSVPVMFLVLTNGTSVYAFERRAGGLEMIDLIPAVTV